MKKLLRAVALALASLAAPVAAQSPHVGKSIMVPAGALPGSATYCDDGTGKAAICPTPARSLDRAQRAAPSGNAATYSAVFTDVTPVANPTDLSVIAIQNETARAVLLRRVTIRAIGDSAGLVNVFLNFRGATSPQNTIQATPADNSTATSTAYAGIFTANPGNTTDRTIRQGKLQIGTAAAPAPELVFSFAATERPPTLRGLTGSANRQISVNLAGASLPANTKIDVTWEWVEEPVRQILFLGDSLFAGTTNLLPSLALRPGGVSELDLRNLGSNGKRLIDLLPTAAQNTGGLDYPLYSVIGITPPYGVSAIPTDVVMGYLTNDVRDGSTSLAQAISRLDAFLYIMKNGTVAGQSWTSTKAGGAGTTFTWNATLAARPQARIWLLGPNSYLADDPTNTGAIPASGLFAGMTQAQRSQAATDIVYNAYQAFVGDARVFKVVQRQDFVSPTTGLFFGRTVRTAATNPTMRDLLHPNAAIGEALEAEQIAIELQL